MPLRTSIDVRTDEQLLLAATRKKFRPATATYNGVPAATHLTTVILTTNAKLNETQMDDLETAIENIAGVNVAKVLHQGPDGGVPTPPADHVVDMRSELTLEFRSTV